MGDDEGNITYSKSGVDYGSIDPAKVSAQSAAAGTAGNLNYFGMQEIAASRGESAYVWKEENGYRALVVEGLGTKNLVADALRPLTGKSYYDQIAQDTVAMIVNDLVVVGALPNVINAYFAIGDSAWLEDKERSADLITGWKKACDLAGAAWGGGETPALKGIINPETIDLAGSAIGSVKSPEPILGEGLLKGDDIVLVESSGVHSNGLTLARSIADKTAEGYSAKLTDGRSYGEALLSPTHIYVSFVREMLEKELHLHYMVNITGHGWRKIMRANKDFTYTLDFVPDAPSEFAHIQEQAGVDDKEMYGNFNMGAGFAVFAPVSETDGILEAAKSSGLKAWKAGKIENGPKKVVIKPKNIIFEGDSLEVR